MGYTTDFWGELTLSKPLDPLQYNYINQFSNTRRMRRDVNKLMELYKGKHGHPTPVDETPEGIYGKEGEYFVHNDGNCGQNEDDSILDYNQAPGQMPYDANMPFNTRYNESQRRIKSGECQPGLWCQWVVNGDDPQTLTWDGGEKFYNYVEWLRYLIKHFFERWNVKLNGEIRWQGEEPEDMGLIVVNDNVVIPKYAKITFEESDEE